MASWFKSKEKGFFGAGREAGRGARRVKLFLAVFALAAVATALAVIFVPKVKSILHSSAESAEGYQEENLQAGALFKDVAADDEYAPEIAFLKKKELARGFEDGTYKPTDPVKREEFVKLVVAAGRADPHPLSNSYCFKDVGNEWFAPYVCYAKNKGLVQGYENGKFGTGTNITVKEALTIIGGSFGADIDGAAVDAANLQTADLQLLPADILPESDLTRAQAAGLVVRALNASNAAR